MRLCMVAHEREGGEGQTGKQYVLLRCRFPPHPHPRQPALQYPPALTLTRVFPAELVLLQIFPQAVCTGPHRLTIAGVSAYFVYDG